MIASKTVENTKSSLASSDEHTLKAEESDQQMTLDELQRNSDLDVEADIKVTEKASIVEVTEEDLKEEVGERRLNEIDQEPDEENEGIDINSMSMLRSFSRNFSGAVPDLHKQDRSDSTAEPRRLTSAKVGHVSKLDSFDIESILSRKSTSDTGSISHSNSLSNKSSLTKLNRNTFAGLRSSVYQTSDFIITSDLDDLI